MPAYSRASHALTIGDQLIDLGKAGANENLPDQRLSIIDLTIGQVIESMDTLVRKCREVKGMYLNYPSVREVILASGDKIYSLREELAGIKTKWHTRLIHHPDESFKDLSIELMQIGQAMKLLEFAPARKAQSPMHGLDSND